MHKHTNTITPHITPTRPERKYAFPPKRERRTIALVLPWEEPKRRLSIKELRALAESRAMDREVRGICGL